MNQKAIGVIIVIAACLIVAGVFGAATPMGKAVTIAIDCDGRTLFCHEYRLDFYKVATAYFLYGGRYDEMANKRYSGDFCALIRDLNADLYDDLRTFEQSNYVPAQDASCEFESGRFVYTEARSGSRINMDKLFYDLIVALKKETCVTAEKIVIYPTTDVASLKEITRPVSSFNTVIKGSENRRKNIILAARKLNNACVMPGEKFSFNERVGERTEANGFLTAHVIKDGEFVDGVGGGVCQASTTLYNAWLGAGLAVNAVSAHSLPVNYVPASLDAMVSSASDLVLFNDSACPVYVWAREEDGCMRVTIYGRPSGYDIRTRSVTIRAIAAKYDVTDEEIDWNENETERIIKRAKDGLVSESYRDYYKDGVLVRTEKLRRNEYKPQDGVKAIRQNG